MAAVQGNCDARFDAVKDLLSQSVASGLELGASICVNHEGQDLIDIWAGHTDRAATQEWHKDTIVNVWSSSKNVTNLALLICHDRKLLSVHEPIYKYWPEFNTSPAKAAILVKHILSHSTGLSGWQDPSITLADVADPTISTPALAAQEPWWEPSGSKSGYHALSQGHLAGELVRRVTGKTLKTFIAEEIAAPLGADFQLGAKEEDWDRVSTLIPPADAPWPPGMEESVAFKTLNGPKPNAEFALSEVWRRGEVGAANGHSNARGLNRIGRVVSLGGEAGGVRLLSPETIEEIFVDQVVNVDLVLGQPTRWGVGFGLPMKESRAWVPMGKRCFWGGWGGSLHIMDVENRMTITYVMNKMGHGTLGSDRTAAYIDLIYKCFNETVKRQ